MQAIKDYVSGLKIGDVQQHKNMAIAPLIREGTSSLDYLVLEEALSQGLQIKEERDRTVPFLFVENGTGKEVLMVYGEIIEGGAQHRALDANIYLAKEFKGKIPVKCVEAHRWETAKCGFSAARRVVGVATRGAMSKGQQEAWRSASVVLGAHGVSSPTDSIKAVYEQKGADLGEYLKHFNPIGQVGNVVAIVTANNQTVYGVELFGKPETFSKMHKKLMESYILDALLGKGEISLTTAQAKEFLSRVNGANFSSVSPVSLGEDYRVNGTGINGSALSYQNNTVYFNMATVDGKTPARPEQQIYRAGMTNFSGRIEGRAR